MGAGAGAAGEVAEDLCLQNMGGCQNYGPFLGALNNRCRIIIGTPKGALILTTTHMCN